MKFKILLLPFLCLVFNGLAQLPDRDWGEPGNTIYNYLKEGKAEYENGEYDQAFEKLTACQFYSKVIQQEELHFLSAIELANFFIITGKMDEAEKEFQSIRMKNEFLADSRCRYYHRLAFYYNQKGVSDSAKIMSLNALAIADRIGFKEVKGISFNELGHVYEKEQAYDSAVYYYDLATQVFVKGSFDYANASFNRARVFEPQKQYDSVVHYMSQLKTMIDSTDWYNLKVSVNHYISVAYFYLGDSTKAYFYRSETAENQIQLMKKNSGKNIEKLQVAYDTQKKNLEIKEQQNQIEKEKESITRLTWLLITAFFVLVLLTLLIFLIRRTNKRLKQLVKENEFLVGEANHRIKNNLQIIVSLVSREMIKHEGDPRDIDSLKNIASKIESISSLHQQLYVNDEKDAIDMKSYLEKLQLNLNELLNASEVDLQLKMEVGLLCNVSKSLYVGLLFNELVINSIKHAFEETQEIKRIEVSCTRKGKNLQLIYSDNGSGIKPNKIPKLVDMMSRQMKGEYSIKNRDGFHFTITFKAL